MNKSEVLEYFSDIYVIRDHIDQFAPTASVGTADFRSEIGGLMTVRIASSYENLVKAVLIDYSSRYHPEFGGFMERNFEKLNSKVSIADLHKYAKFAGTKVSSEFSRLIKLRKDRYAKSSKIEIEKSYNQILAWRHAFAHSGVKNTTIEEALRKHKEGSPILFSFAEAFEECCPDLLPPSPVAVKET